MTSTLPDCVCKKGNMAAADTYHNVASGTGKFLGTSFKMLTSVPKVFASLGRGVASALHPFSRKEKVRAIVIEELREHLGDENRLQIMTDAIFALQKKLAELGASGNLDELALLNAMHSLKVVDRLSDEEKFLLTSVFQQNIALQKPELEETCVSE